MSDRPHYAHLATELLEREPLPEAKAPSAMQRARALSLMAQEVRVAAARRRRRRFIGGAISGVALAAAAAVAWFSLHSSHPPAPSSRSAWARVVRGQAQLVHAGQPTAMEAATVDAGDHVVTGSDGRATLTLSTGTHVAVAEASDVEVVSQGQTQVFALRAGEITLDVAKLIDGERFLVRTDDAEIEVRGTSFTVAVVPPDAACGDGSKTRLDVAEGVVVIRALGREEKIAAGDHWPRGCVKAIDPPAPAVTTIAPAPTTTIAPPTVSAPRPAVSSSSTSAIVPGSILAAQNDLFAVATAARKRGDVAGAIAGYERYLAKYPGSGLAESATVERMRLLAKVAPDRGAVAARAYLAQYPGGFARAEAEKLAAP